MKFYGYPLVETKHKIVAFPPFRSPQFHFSHRHSSFACCYISWRCDAARCFRWIHTQHSKVHLRSQMHEYFRYTYFHTHFFFKQNCVFTIFAPPSCYLRSCSREKSSKELWVHHHQTFFPSFCHVVVFFLPLLFFPASRKISTIYLTVSVLRSYFVWREMAHKN